MTVGDCSAGSFFAFITQKLSPFLGQFKLTYIMYIHQTGLHALMFTEHIIFHILMFAAASLFSLHHIHSKVKKPSKLIVANELQGQ